MAKLAKRRKKISVLYGAHITTVRDDVNPARMAKMTEPKLLDTRRRGNAYDNRDNERSKISRNQDEPSAVFDICHRDD